MKILVIDDHSLIRDGLRHLLLQLDSSVTVLEADNCQKALQLMTAHMVLDLVVMDFVLPDGGGFDLVRQISAQLPKTPIVIISMIENHDIITQAFKAGVKGYITKTTGADIILQALKHVCNGGSYFPPALVRNEEKEFANPPDNSDHISLTSRQREILQLLSRGKTNKEIGRLLGISENTIRTYMTMIYRALNVNNRTEAGHVASQLGLIN